MDSSMDLNNNTDEKIYSLRPRSSIKSNRDFDHEEETWKPRGRTKKRTKEKSAPLSKYRRKTANARERSRMREINEAFEALRRAVPHLKSSSDNPAEKISKIMTLRLAMKYITALSNALEEPNYGEVSLSDIVMSYDGMLTPSGSVSERSELGDDIFTSTLPSESLSSTSPTYDIPGLITPPLSETMHLPSFHHFRCESSLHQTLHSFASDVDVDKSANSSHKSHSPALPTVSDDCGLLPSIKDLSKSDSSYHNVLTASNFTLTTSFLTTDFDGLPSPSMDFDHLFIK